MSYRMSDWVWPAKSIVFCELAEAEAEEEEEEYSCAHSRIVSTSYTRLARNVGEIFIFDGRWPKIGFQVFAILATMSDQEGLMSLHDWYFFWNVLNWQTWTDLF